MSFTLQVNVAPSDHPVAEYTLPHQLRQIGHDVDEVLYVFDPRRSARRSRFAADWGARRPRIEALLRDLAATHDKVRIIEVDYAPATRRQVAQRWFGADDLALKDSRGAPFYPYFFALDAAQHDLILHLDCDMLLGGSAEGWLPEAAQHLAAAPTVLFTSPSPGPPVFASDDALPPVIPSDQALSTRAFLTDRGQLAQQLAPLLKDVSLPLAKRVKAVVQGNERQPPAEMVISASMRSRGLSRTEFLGGPPGLWSLHPPYRSDRFTAELPAIIKRVEAGDVPPAQRGDQDINHGYFDWTAETAGFRIRKLWGY